MRSGGLAQLGMTPDDLARLGCRILADPGHPFIIAYRAWMDCYQALANGMLTTGLNAEEFSDLERDMFDTLFK